MRYLTSGESHGKALTVIIEGLPAGIKINPDDVLKDLQDRQKGFGRGERMNIEVDSAEFLSGLWHGKTIGNPLTIQILNKDWENWQNKKTEKKTIPRPGHADLAGLLKYDADDIQTIIERASARETAAKVAAGSVAKIYLRNFGVKLIGHTVSIGGINVEKSPVDYDRIRKTIEKSDLRCADKIIERKMINRIKKVMSDGNTLGGTVEVRIYNVPPGLGSYVQWDRRLDGLLAQSLMSINSAKAVELGEGIINTVHKGSDVHDQIYYSTQKGYYRKSNRAGGIEGGMSNGETITARIYLKPIATLRKSLKTVDTKTHRRIEAPYVRSDTVIVPAAGVIAEAAAAWVIAVLFDRKFGGDSIQETLRNYKGYIRQIKRR